MQFSDLQRLWAPVPEYRWCARPPSTHLEETKVKSGEEKLKSCRDVRRSCSLKTLWLTPGGYLTSHNFLEKWRILPLKTIINFSSSRGHEHTDNSTGRQCCSASTSAFSRELVATLAFGPLASLDTATVCFLDYFFGISVSRACLVWYLEADRISGQDRGMTWSKTTQSEQTRTLAADFHQEKCQKTLC